MDRTGVDNIAKLASELTAEVFGKITRAVEEACPDNRELIIHTVAMAFVTVGAQLCKGTGVPKLVVEEQLESIYKD